MEGGLFGDGGLVGGRPRATGARRGRSSMSRMRRRLPNGGTAARHERWPARPAQHVEHGARAGHDGPARRGRSIAAQPLHRPAAEAPPALPPASESTRLDRAMHATSTKNGGTAAIKTLDASRDQARQDKVAAREAAKKAKELHKSQMSRAQLVEKFGEAEAQAELDRRNAKALQAREELKTKAKEWHWLTAEVARLTKLCDDHGIDHKVEVDASDSNGSDAEAPTAETPSPMNSDSVCVCA